MKTAIISCAIALSVLCQTDEKQLIDKIAALEKENAELKKRLEELEALLNQKLKELETVRRFGASANAQESKSTTTSKGSEDFVAPEKPIVCKVTLVNVTEGFVLVDAGEKEGSKTGVVFEIVRNDARVAIAKVEKLTKDKTGCLLRVVQGEYGKIKPGDAAIALRALPSDVNLGYKKRAYKVSGIVGKFVIVDAGTKDKVKIGDIFYIYRDAKQVAKALVTDVDDESATAKVQEGTDASTLKVGDDVVFGSAPGKVLLGQVKISDKVIGIQIDVGMRQGARRGQRYQVRREGKPIDDILINDVYDDYSVCKPLKLKEEDFKAGDIVELVED